MLRPLIRRFQAPPSTLKNDVTTLVVRIKNQRVDFLRQCRVLAATCAGHGRCRRSSGMKQWERRGEMSKICAVIGVVRCYFCSSLKKETGTFFERCDATLLFRRFSGRCDAQSNVNSEPCFQQHPLSLVLLGARPCNKISNYESNSS